MVPAKPILHVAVVPQPAGVVLSSDAGTITVASSHPVLCNKESLCDYAAWYFLPVAMRLDRPLHISGRGAAATIDNWQRLSSIWQAWLPGHFHEQRLTFDVTEERPALRSDRPDILYYSGGLDAAHAGVVRHAKGLQQHLLTVQGMDYTVQDQQRFDALIAKTAPFARQLSDTRIVVKSDAYALYRNLGVNLGTHQLMHIFALAGAGFFHAKSYNHLLLADDEPLAAQFVTFPWGTNAVTNALFSDGVTRLLTLERDISRAEKTRLVLASELATRSLSFCWNRDVQPENCGICDKCLRTKLLSLAEAGTVPPIFRDPLVPADWAARFTWRPQEGFFFLHEIINRARETGRTSLFPDFERSVQSLLRRQQILRHVDTVWPAILRPRFLASLLSKLTGNA